jgi:nickel-dependent lactate racemase
MRLQYGDTTVDVALPDQRVLGIIEPQRLSVPSCESLVKQSLLEPVGMPRLKTLFRNNKPGDVVILVSDRTRSITHYDRILDLLLTELVDAGIDEKNIECLVAVGTHRAHTEEENRQLYGNCSGSIRFTCHDCHKDLISIGKTSTDLEVMVNKRAQEADFVIATGKINFHYMAGFSGGRKAVLPGIAGYETIRSNHCKLRREGVTQGVIKGNIIAQEMNEAAEMFGLDYLVNMVETSDNKTSHVVCGDPARAFAQGLAVFKNQRLVEITQPADCVIVSAGGCQGDRTFYVGHKALTTAIPAVKSGGTIVLTARCAQGVGNDAFFHLLAENTVDDLLCASEDAITIGGHRAYQTARILHDYNIIVVTDENKDILSTMQFTVVSSMTAALERVQQREGDDFVCYVIPDGHAVMPVMKGTS